MKTCFQLGKAVTREILTNENRVYIAIVKIKLTRSSVFTL